jgi:hypothetical protein
MTTRHVPMKIFQVLADNEPETRAGDYDYDTGMRVYIRIEGPENEELVRMLFHQQYPRETWEIRGISEVKNFMFGSTSWEITD